MTEVTARERVMAVLFGADETLSNIKFFARTESTNVDPEELFETIYNIVKQRQSGQTSPLIDFPEFGERVDVRAFVARI